uniref:SH2 domain-containing protein n=2 Tax=Electrophorus electricus TaxID=8005 RepID=A0A4W4GIC5_ELEEL
MQSRTVEELLYSNILSVKMDIDYQTMKDAESHERERLLCCPPVQPRPMPRPSVAPESQCTSKKPPIKPRRSVKIRPTTQGDAGQSNSQANQKENEVEVKRIVPSQVLYPHGPLEAQTPSLRAHILLWFQKTQLPRLHTPGSPLPSWLHGFATRREAEQLLQEKEPGCFLLRLSESKVGFVLSYRGGDRCRHFIIEEESKVSGMNGQYVIAGEQSRHDSLEELIDYYTHNPVGPFSEMLTMPCVQANGSCEDEAKLGVDDIGTRDRRPEKTEISTQPNGNSSAADSVYNTTGLAQYAVVCKALRKTHSLPECKIGIGSALPVKENATQEPVVGSATLADLTWPVDVPYARVNKPPRQIPQNLSVSATDPSSQGAVAAIAPQSLASAASMAEQKYWELEPLHTYEETLHTRRGHEEIDFYAVGRRREIAGEVSVHHLYSEVNIKGTRDDILPMQAPPPIRRASMYNSTTSSSRSKPVLPQRPPLRPVHASPRPENSIQSLGGAAGLTAPPYSSLIHSEQRLPTSSNFSIYEQIPERPSNSRPPLPPNNPKR